jgi:hypothetical protein
VCLYGHANSDVRKKENNYAQKRAGVSRVGPRTHDTEAGCNAHEPHHRGEKIDSAHA